MKVTPVTVGFLAVTLFGFPAPASAASILFGGTFASDGDIAQFLISVPTPGTITLQSLGYGGWGSPAVSPGGFATSLSLYELNDLAGTQLANDFLGGTAIGAGCSNGAQQDPTTHLCEDALISSFSLPAGSYLATLTEQGNDGPDPLSSGFLLNPGQNFSPGPFDDPGLPPGVQRTGNWALLVTTTGTVNVSAVPEPSSIALWVAGLAGLAMKMFVKRRHLSS
jgi:hypothetical protein